VGSILRLYTELPHTPSRHSRDDRFVVQKLERQQIPLRRVQAALLLGSARRCFRTDPEQHLLPIRSIRFFLPVIEELAFTHIDQGYVDYLGRKLAEFLGKQLPLKSNVMTDVDSEKTSYQSAGKQLSLPW
jgi:hypothetical protein